MVEDDYDEEREERTVDICHNWKKGDLLIVRQGATRCREEGIRAGDRGIVTRVGTGSSIQVYFFRLGREVCHLRDNWGGWEKISAEV